MIEKKSCWKQYGKAGQTLEMDRYDKETPDSYRSVYSELFSGIWCRSNEKDT